MEAAAAEAAAVTAAAAAAAAPWEAGSEFKSNFSQLRVLIFQ